VTNVWRSKGRLSIPVDPSSGVAQNVCIPRTAPREAAPVKSCLRISVGVFLLAVVTTAQQPPLEAPATVYVVTSANATALYHRQGCAALRAATTTLTLGEARKRFFHPHTCIAKEGRPSDVAAAPVVTGAPTTPVPRGAASNATETVYATRTGAKYHRTSHETAQVAASRASDRPCCRDRG
jgi:hypothetical protein